MLLACLAAQKQKPAPRQFERTSCFYLTHYEHEQEHESKFQSFSQPCQLVINTTEYPELVNYSQLFAFVFAMQQWPHIKPTRSAQDWTGLLLYSQAEQKKRWALSRDDEQSVRRTANGECEWRSESKVQIRNTRKDGREMRTDQARYGQRIKA